ncbi:MAG: hypothetical protein RBS14_05540 [Atribacterota bacterium]|jgi:uncharacterized membrane protein YccC|nr:hypothetical protein [Atribacterota bacterium]
MTDKSPRTVKEALIAEMLADIDTMLDRMEKADQGIRQTVAVLTGADEKYRQAVMSFTEQAKAELAAWLDQKATQAIDAQEARLRTLINELINERLGSLPSPENQRPKRWFGGKS